MRWLDRSLVGCAVVLLTALPAHAFLGFGKHDSTEPLFASVLEVCKTRYETLDAYVEALERAGWEEADADDVDQGNIDAMAMYLFWNAMIGGIDQNDWPANFDRHRQQTSKTIFNEELRHVVRALIREETEGDQIMIVFKDHTITCQVPSTFAREKAWLEGFRDRPRDLERIFDMDAKGEIVAQESIVAKEFHGLPEVRVLGVGVSRVNAEEVRNLAEAEFKQDLFLSVATHFREPLK